jgi:hypothetical protein
MISTTLLRRSCFDRSRAGWAMPRRYQRRISAARACLTAETFSRDIAYSRSPTASRASNQPP